MATDFSSKQPAPENVASELFPPMESGVPVTGFTEAPINESECCNFEVGPGVGANTSKIR